MLKVDMLTPEQRQFLQGRWDSDAGLQEKYDGNFEAFLRATIAENEKVISQPVQQIVPQHCF